MLPPRRKVVNRPPGKDQPLRKQPLELLGLVEGADQGEIEALAPDHILRDALDLLRGDGVQSLEELLRVDSLTLEHLAAQAEHDHPLRILELEQEPALGEVARLLELRGLDRLLGYPPQLVDDGLEACVRP